MSSLHGPEYTEAAQENVEADDKALVSECLRSKDDHAKARITLDALGDGELPDPNQEIENDVIANLAAAEQTMAAAEQALDRATAAAFARAADREHSAFNEEDPPPDAQVLQAAVAKHPVRASFPRPRQRSQKRHRRRQRSRRNLKAQKTTKKPPQPEPTMQEAGSPRKERKSRAARAAQQQSQNPEDQRKASVRTPRRKAPATSGDPPHMQERGRRGQRTDACTLFRQ
eukprot:gene34916-45188_t